MKNDRLIRCDFRCARFTRWCQSIWTHRTLGWTLPRPPRPITQCTRTRRCCSWLVMGSGVTVLSHPTWKARRTSPSGARRINLFCSFSRPCTFRVSLSVTCHKSSKFFVTRHKKSSKFQINLFNSTFCKMLLPGDPYPDPCSGNKLQHGFSIQP